MELTTIVTPFNGPSPSAGPVPDSAVGSSESNADNNYSWTVSDSPSESNSDESDALVPSVPVNSNGVLTNKSAATIAVALRMRKYASWPLQHHKLALLQASVVDGNII